MNTLDLLSVHRPLRRLAVCGLLLAALLRIGLSHAVEPSAPATSTTGSYTVTWGGCFVYCWLEEKAGASGAWVSAPGQVVSNSPGPGDGYASISGKGPGTYYYRAGDLYIDETGYYLVYSNEIAVTVAVAPPPSDTVATQSQYTYETRRGDINGDGLPDLLVRRTSGGAPGNGTVDTVILQRLANGAFTQIVPSAAQLSVAQGWPVVLVDLALSDFNLDGFIDIFLSNLGSYFSGAVGQIIVASGQAFVQAPQALVPMDAKFTNFANQIGNWVENPSWYTNNAPAVLLPIWGWTQNCYYFYDELGNVYYQCDYYYTIVDWVYQLDYSGFDQDGLALTAAFHPGSDGQLIPDLTPGSADAKSVDAIFRRVFNVPVLRGTLDTGCNGGVMSYDGETQIDCTPDYMGQLLLWRISTFTERGDWRYLTAGEKAAAAAEGLQIKNVDQVRVYHRSYNIFLRKRVSAPNGNVYIGNAQEQFGTPWSEDYSLEPNIFHFSTLIHELTHVYQVRTLGWSLPTMLKKVIAAGDNYVYMPLVPGKTYFQYSMEQQAEMVRDRFLKRRGYITYDSRNNAVTVDLLNGVIPF